MLSNSVIAASAASGYLTALVLHLNPSLPLAVSTVAPLALVVTAAYGVNLTVAFYALIVLRQIVAVEVLSPGWLSVRLLSWLGAMAAGGGATLMWLNLDGFGPVLGADAQHRLAASAIIVSSAGVVLLAIALAHLGRRGGRVSAALLGATLLASVIGPLAVRGPGRVPPLPVRSPIAAISGPDVSRPHARLILLIFDGASLDMIAPAVAAGRLANIGHIFDQGAVLHLATLRPTQAETVWSAAATGRLPMANGVRSALVYRLPGGEALQLLPAYCFAQALVRFGFVEEQPLTSADLMARPIWRILGDHGVSVGLIGWPLTTPAPQVDGFVVSDRFHGLSEAALALDSSVALFPPSLLPEVRAALGEPASPDPVALVATLGAPQPATDIDSRQGPAPVVADRLHLQLMTALEATAPSRFLAVRFPGIDAVGHRFLRYAHPEAFGDVSEEERRRFGRVLDEYYGFVDTLVGRALARLGPDDLLLVVSGFGMEPLLPGKRVLELLVGDAELSGTHERAPDGFALAFGQMVAPGRPSRAAIADIAPTVLYFFGLPVARDMEGLARTDIFKASFTEERPVTYIPSYGR